VQELLGFEAETLGTGSGGEECLCSSGIETPDDEFTKDNKKRPGRNLTIQQREALVFGRDKVKCSLGKATELMS
jgi:hypothetical protein